MLGMIGVFYTQQIVEGQERHDDAYCHHEERNNENECEHFYPNFLDNLAQWPPAVW